MRSASRTLPALGALGLAVALLLFLPVASVAQVCDHDVVADELTLWLVHSCWPEFRDWFRPYFNFQADHWQGDWGWDFCDPKQPFPKMWDSAFLLTYGLQDTSLGPWHSDYDYREWSAGSRHGFRYEPEYAFDAIASAFAGWFVTDRVEMKCLGFNNKTAGVRAGTMAHEATHIIYGGSFGGWSHQSNPPGSNCTEDCSDDWFFHNLTSYPYGSLAGKLHSMNQIQIEFDCDLAQFGEGWVPNTLRLVAQSEANNRMNNRIRNPPGWTCGLPRPFLLGGGEAPATLSLDELRSE